MSDLHCPKCREGFDEGSHAPRMFSGCGHTLCQLCITNLLETAVEGMVQCPDPDDDCPPAHPDNGIDSFPINRIIYNHVRKTRTDRSKSIVLPSRVTCLEHDKPRDIVCLTDAEPVCSDCALFGNHKSHDFLPFVDFQKKTAEDLKALEAELDTLKGRSYAAAHKADIRKLREDIQLKFNEIVCKIEAEFSRITDDLNRQKTELVKNLERIFEGFEAKTDEISAKSELNGNTLRNLVTQTIDSKATNERMGFEEPGFLERFCPRPKLKETAERLASSIGQIEKLRDTDIFRKIEALKVVTNWEVVAPKVAGVVDLIIDDAKPAQETPKAEGKAQDGLETPGNSRSISPYPSPSPSQTAGLVINLTSSDLGGEYSNTLFGCDVLLTNDTPEDDRKREVRDSRTMLPGKHMGVGLDSRQSQEGLLSTIHPPDRVAPTSFVKRATYPKKAMENQNETDPAIDLTNPKPPSNDLLGKSEIDSEVSLLNSPSPRSSCDAKDANPHSRSFIIEIQPDKRVPPAAPGDTDLDESARSQIQLKRKGSLLPSKRLDPNNSFIATRDVSPFAPKRSDFLAGLETTPIFRNDAPNPSQGQGGDSGPTPLGFRMGQGDEGVRSSAVKLTRYGKANELDPPEDRLNTSEILIPKDANFSKVSVRSRQITMIGQPKSATMFAHPKPSLPGPAKPPSDILISEPPKTSSLLNPRRMDLTEQFSPAFETKVKSTLDNKSFTNYTTEKGRPSGGNGPVPNFFNPYGQILPNAPHSSRVDTDRLQMHAQGHGPIQNPGPLRPKVSLEASETRIRNPLKNSSLANDAATEMSYADRKINDASLQTIIPEIAKNKKVRVLNLSNNFITEAGVESLVKKLAGHPSLETILLRGNFIEEKVFDLLRANAKNLKKLSQFNFADNKTLKDRSRIKMMIGELKKLGIRVEV